MSRSRWLLQVQYARDAAQQGLAQAGLGPLQLTPYRREYSRALVIVGDYDSAAEQLQQMRAASSHLPSPALAGRFESDVLREESHIYQCRCAFKAGFHIAGHLSVVRAIVCSKLQG